MATELLHSSHRLDRVIITWGTVHYWRVLRNSLAVMSINALG